MLLQKIVRGEPIPGKPVMFSSLTGKAISVEEVCTHSHWVDNSIHRVNFYEAVVNMCASPSGKVSRDLGDESGTQINHVLELGPHAALRGPLRDIFRVHELNIEYHTVLDRGKDALSSALETMGKVFCSGYPVNLSCVNGFSENSEGPAILVNLPQYPFNHSRKYWQEGRLNRNLRFQKFPPHELLGSPVLDWNNLEPWWIKSIRPSNSPWVKDHQVDGSIVYPAAGMLVMVLEAVRQLNVPARPIEGYVFRDVCFRKALVVPPNDSVDVQTQLTDISPAFFEKAKDKFRQYLDRMTFAVLNIEKDPAEQGFENGSYDVIAASNVSSLENTASLHSFAELILQRSCMQPRVWRRH